MIPYSALAESVKDYDRVTRRVLDSLGITYVHKPDRDVCAHNLGAELIAWSIASTNFGRIAASPEALAEFLDQRARCDRCSQMDHKRDYTKQECDGRCGNGILDWLNQPESATVRNAKPCAVTDCPYQTIQPCEAAEGCGGYEAVERDGNHEAD